MSVETVLTAILRAGYITETADDPPHYLPARPFETITVKNLLDVMRTAGERASLSAERLPHEPEVERMLARVDDAVDATLRGHSLRELALAGVPPDKAA